MRSPAREAVDISDAVLATSTLPAAVRDELAQAVGAAHVRTDDAARVAHTRGWSTPDLLKLRAGDASDAPDAVVLPGNHDEVLRVLESAPSTASRSCRSPAARRSSAAWPPSVTVHRR